MKHTFPVLRAQNNEKIGNTADRTGYNLLINIQKGGL